MQNQLPESFKDLKPEELYRSAIEDFAVDVSLGDSAEVIRAALLESGVKWADYVKQHPEVAPEEEKKKSAVVGRESMGLNRDQETNVVVTHAPLTDPGPVFAQEDRVLVKMDRENPYFEFQRYVFTDKQPFQIMDATAATQILKEEHGFAIARPDEAQEFFGQ